MVSKVVAEYCDISSLVALTDKWQKMAEHELTPKNSIGGPFPPELDSDSASDDDDDITSGPMVIKSNTSPAIQPKMRPSIFTADFDTPGTGEQVLGQVMDPVSPSHALFNIVAVSYLHNK